MASGPCKTPVVDHGQTICVERVQKATPTSSPAAARTWRTVAHLVRPLIITTLAALAFAVLLRFHHAEFEDSMVRSFQRQQLDATWSWADAVERQVAVGLIIKTFLKDLRETLSSAQGAALARDEERLAELAHRWKGSLGLLGARRALSCAVRLEEACRLEESEHLLESLQKLHTELLVVERALSNAEQESVPCRSS